MAIEGEGEGQGSAGSADDLLGGAAAGAGGDGGAGDGGNGGAGGEGGAGGDGGAGSGGADGWTDPDWYAQLSGEGEGESAANRDWAKSMGIKDIDALAKVARDNQRALRESGRIKVPGEGASAEEVAAYHKAIGVPDDPKGYEFTPPTGPDGQPLQLRTDMLDRIATAAHKHGVAKGALEAVVNDYIQGEMDAVHAADVEQQQKAAAWVKAQGAEGTQKIAAINRAASALGLSRDDMVGIRSVLGADRALTMFARLGAGLSEDTFVDSGRRTFGIDPNQAQAMLDQKMGNPEWAKKAMEKGTPEYAERERLIDAAGEAANRAAAA